MSEIRALFWDVGGVLGTNGWDTSFRRATVERFGLDWDEFEARHEPLADPMEIGRVTLDHYLDEAVFHRERSFSRDEFRAAMFAFSRPSPESLALVDRVARAGRCFQATLNNEFRELNAHRIEKFGLRSRFPLFLSSCYLGVMKPDPEIFRLALELTQRQPSECLFIDDRPENLEPARALGMRTFHFRGAEGLRTHLDGLGLLRG